MLTGEVDHLDYALVLFALPLVFYFAVTYILSVIAEADHNGKMSGLMSFALAVGAGTGPALFGTLLSSDGPVVLAMGILIGAGAAMILFVHTQLQSRTIEATT